MSDLIAIYQILYVVVGRKPIGVLLGNSIYILYGMINYYLIMFRGKPLLPTDLSALGTALDVARGYTYPITVKEIVTVASALGLWYLFKKSCEKRSNALHGRKAVLVHGVLIIMIGIGVFTSGIYQSMKVVLWDSDILYFCKSME